MSTIDYTHVIDARTLHSNLTQPNWVIVDCRFDLADPDWGFADYQKGHIPGAVYAHLEHDLSGPRTRDNGRHPLPEPEIFQTTLGSLGIDSSSQVVVYDTSGGSFAARLWWMLKYYGHSRAAVLNGGLSAWTAASFSLQTGVWTNSPRKFSGFPHPEMVVTTPEMETLINQPTRIIDARAPERYRGEIEPLDPVAGHIPGALNRFHQDNLDPSGFLLPVEDLKEAYSRLLAETPTSQAVVYCGSGVTSCHHLLAMAAAGLPLARLYAGSWSEWIRDPGHPIATGPEPQAE